MPLEWPRPPRALTLIHEEVHVWRADLSNTSPAVEELARTLDDQERLRAERFAFESDRRHFVRAHAILRAILGAYVGVDPEELRFSYGPQGKPSLAPESDGAGLRFNMSHSNGLAAYAVTRDRAIGVDVEEIRTDLHVMRIAERFFSRAEAEAIRSVPEARRPEAFFELWTLREAYLKGTGKGLSAPLHGFHISPLSGKPAAGAGSRFCVEGTPHWSLRSLRFAPGFAGGVAVEGDDWTLRCWQWCG